MKQQVEGRSLLPLLKNPQAEWADRTLVHHVGRWAKGKAAECEIHEVRDPELAIHAGQQQRALRPQGRPRRNQERHQEAKFAKCSIQNSRYTLVNNAELYDLKADPGEKTNVIADHPDVVATLRASYEQWWKDVQPMLVNEAVTNIPKINPLKELYWKQFGRRARRGHAQENGSHKGWRRGRRGSAQSAGTAEKAPGGRD